MPTYYSGEIMNDTGELGRTDLAHRRECWKQVVEVQGELPITPARTLSTLPLIIKHKDEKTTGSSTDSSECMTEDEEEFMDSLPDSRQTEMNRRTGLAYPVTPTRFSANDYPHVRRIERALSHIANGRLASQ
jgi:hypothetical protein